MSKTKKILPELRFPEFKKKREWNKLELLNISNVIMGSSPSSEFYNENKIGLPLLQGNADIKNRFSAPRIYTTEVTKECKVGDILLSVRAPVGTVAKSLHNACIGRGMSVIRAKKPNSQEYLYQWLFSYELSWNKIAQGGTFEAVNSDDIRNLLVPIPDPTEQQKIASCLSSLDEVIEAHSKKLELLKDHKKGLMQNLFPQEGEKVPKLRFKEFENSGEWEKLKLLNISDVIMGSSPCSEFYNENKIGLPLLQGNADIKNKLSAPRIYTTKITKECEVGDILLSVRAPVGTVAKSLHNACIGRGMSAIRAKKLNSQEYLYQWLFSYELSWGKIAQGGTFEAVNSDDIRNLLVPIPAPPEQQKIASYLSSLDKAIEAQEEKIEQLKLHKKGLMQGLFPKISD